MEETYTILDYLDSALPVSSSATLLSSPFRCDSPNPHLRLSPTLGTKVSNIRLQNTCQISQCPKANTDPYIQD
jgi:hypothetical protein